MTRPVRGFLTKEGKFFSTKTEANLHEATTDFHRELQSHLEEAGFSGMLLDFMMDKVREFVLINRDVVKNYITLMLAIPEVNKHDIRSVLLQPPTGPVTEPLDNLEEDDAFVQAIFGPLGSDDGTTEENGTTTLDRLDGESPESIPE